MHVLVVANDITPEFGLPVAAPGLRAWSLALGLRAHGHEVQVVVNDPPVAKAARGGAPPSASGVVPIDMGLLDVFVRTHRPDVVVFTNSNHVAHLADDHGATIVYDFFAPKMLERGFAERTGDIDLGSMAALRQRKIDALGRADVIALNGSKKHAYALAWLLQCDRDPATVPIVDVPFGVPVIEPVRHDGPLRLAIAGYVQAWSGAGESLDRLLRTMDEVDVEVHLVLARHWGGGGSKGAALGGGYERLLSHSSVISHDPMAFDDFRAMLATVDATIDLFGHTLEREYAMVTRTLVALCTGTAVIHPAWTEVGVLVDRYDAGWLLADGRTGLGQLCHRLVDDREEVWQRRQNATRLAREVLDPVAATAALSETLVAARS